MPDKVKWLDGDIDKVVTRALKNNRLPKEELAGVVEFVKKVNNVGLRPVGVFPIGIPAQDGVNVEAHLSEADLGSLIDLLRTPGVRGVKIFPKGIIRPDLFVANLEFDATR